MTNTLKQLAAAGTSPWLDNIRRGWLQSGEFRRMVDEGVVGVTSNPTIFQKAIADSTDYDGAVAALAASGTTPTDAFFELAIADVREAADQIRGVYDATGHLDGYVSFELPPAMANDTAKSIAAAPDFFQRIDRPNIFIKIPGTSAGAPAIEETIAAGIPVNVTLLFSHAQYQAAAEAYLRGIERRIDSGQDPEVGSVASVFVSRWDSAVKDKVPEALRNQLGIAVAKQTYKAYRSQLGSPRWQRIFNAGARPQRLLWASTGTKDPSASDILYVRSLAAPFTVNTMPEGTLKALADHGLLGGILSPDGGDAAEVLGQFAAAGVDVEALAARLQDEGAKSFVASWHELMNVIASKTAALDRAG